MRELFTHTDLDGIGCAVLATLAFHKDVTIHYCNYETINEQVNDFLDHDHGGEIFITDISV